MGYYLDKRENFKDGSLPDASVSGLGDMTLTAGYAVWQDPWYGIEVSPFVYVKLPVGKFDCENDGIKLPISMQPSSGSYKYAAGVTAYVELSENWYLTTYDFFEYAQRIVSNNFNYQYGPLAYVSAGGYFRTPGFLTAGAGFSFEHMGKARNESAVLSSTSYSLLKVAPQVVFRLSEGFNVTVSAEIPLWRRVSGVQMSSSWAMQLRMVYDMKLQ